MSEFDITISAKFWPRSATLTSIAEQYNDLWRFAKMLETIGIPMDQWYPPADTPASSMLNLAFDQSGVTPAAMAMAGARPVVRAGDVRSLGAWNGIDEAGGMAFNSLLAEGVFPSSLEFSASDSEPLKDPSHVLKIVSAILDIWSPVMVLVGPYAYTDKAVFSDRPPVSWMLYLPFKIDTVHAPEASKLVPVLGSDNKHKGTIVISVWETFDVQNPEHVKRANDLEIRLADQDLLPRFMELMKFRPAQE